MKTLIALLLSALGLNAATVQFYMTNSAGVADTNYFRLIPIENPVLANGGVITRGPALRCYPAATGFFQTNLTVGWWQMTNSFLGQGILLEVPNDSFTYNATNLMVSGFNTYVMSGLVGVTSSNGSVTIYPPAGRGTVDLAASGSIPLLAGSNIVIYQSGGSNVINSTASGTGSATNYVIPNAGTTNNGVASVNASNIVFMADSPAGGPNAIFTNSSYSIAIGSRFGVGTIFGNNAIYIGGSAGGAGPNSLSLGVGAGSGGANEDGSVSQAGSIAIGNQVDCFSRNSMVISPGISSGMQFFGINNCFIGNFDSDAYNLTNVFFWGHRASSINLSNNTFYFGNGPGGGVSMDRVQRYVFLGSAGNGHLTGNGDELTNVSAFRLVATNNHTFSYTNDPDLGNMWATTNDDGLWAGYFRAKALQIIDPTTGIIDNNLAPVITGDSSHNFFWGFGGAGPLAGDNQGTFMLQGSGNFKVNNKAFFGSTTVTNATTNQFLTANQLIGTGGSKQMADVFIGAGLTLGGNPLTLSGTGGAGGWGNLEDKGTNETALGYFVFVNPTNSNNGTNWTFFTGTNWYWQNVGTNGGGGYKTNSFLFGNGSTSNVLQILNPSGQTIVIGNTNGVWRWGTNNQMVLDTSGNLTISGQFNGSGSGLTAGSVPFNSLPQISGYNTLANPNAGSAIVQSYPTAQLLDPIGNTVFGIAYRDILGVGYWSNSAQSSVTLKTSSITVTNNLNANTIGFTNNITGYGVAPGSFINLGLANATSNSWNTVTGSNDVYWVVGNSTILLWTNPMGGAALGWTIPTTVNMTNKNFSTGLVHSDSNGKLTSSALSTTDLTADGSTLTNLTYRYTTNAIPAQVLSWGKAYTTNISANWTASLAAPAVAYYESIILMVTNSSSTDYKITMPSGVWGTPGSGTPPAYYCTNKMLTKIVIEHYGGSGLQYTNSSKVDYAP